MQTLETITNYILNNSHVELKPKMLVIDGHQCRSQRLCTSLLENLTVSIRSMSEDPSEVLDIMDTLILKDTPVKLYASIREAVKPKTLTYKPLDMEFHRPDYVEYMVAVDVNSTGFKKQNHFVIDKSTMSVDRMTYDGFEEMLPSDADMRNEYLRENKVLCHTDYLPHDKLGFKDIMYRGKQWSLLNTFVIPTYKKLPPTNNKPKYWQEFLEYFFPIEKERKNVIEWVYWSLKARARSYMWLQGVPGAGKGTFINILSRLHGEENFSLLNTNSMDSRFNASMLNKTLVAFDELKCKEGKEKNNLKSYQNETIVIEKKNVDANTFQNYASFIITTNNKSDIELLWNDRKISTPTLAEKNIANEWDYEKLKEFNELIDESDEWVNEVYHDIISNDFTENNTHIILKNDKFYDIVFDSLPTWQRFILEEGVKYQKANRVPISELRERYEELKIYGSGIPTYTNKIEDFLNNYRHGAEEHIVGRIVNGARGTKCVEFTDEWIELNKVDSTSITDILAE